MSILGALFMVILFAVLLEVLGVVDRAREVVATSQTAMSALRNPDLSDDEKERTMQQSSVTMFKLLFFLVVGTAAAILIPLAVVWVAEQAGLVTVGAVLDLFLRWDFLIGSSLLGIAVYLAVAKWLRRNS